MANASIDTILNAEVTTKVVTQIAGTSSSLLNLFGMQPGGPNVSQQGHRNFGYDVFNDSRKVGRARAPGTGAARVTRQKVGRVNGTFPRMHESIYLLAEETHNLRRLGGTAAEFDEAGVNYISRQLRDLGLRSANFRTALLVGMLRDSLYLNINDDDYYVDYTGGTANQINFQMPAGNKGQLNMLGGGNIITATWATASTDIFTQLLNINAAFQELTGGRLEMVICKADLWGKVTNNTGLRDRAGSSNKTFEVFERKVGTDQFGNPINEFIGRLAALPWIEWHITDEGVEVGAPGSETYQSHIEDDKAVFCGRPDPNWCEMLEGSEPVSEGEGKSKVVRMGLYTWSKEVDDPTADALYALDNAIPALYVPKSIAYGTPVF